MTNRPSLTVIMSVHNGERYLEAAIDSILAQSFTDFEFFVTDDGSSDRTSSILTNYAERHPQIRIFRNESSAGLPSCLNMMAGKARGKYLARMDADDIAHENRFEKQVEFMDCEPAIDVCFTNVNFMNEEGRIICAKGAVLLESYYRSAAIYKLFCSPNRNSSCLIVPQNRWV